ncbi:hypothetical protein JS562_47865, partial [Agrobacterium sp. S2]|nr:hypothetical protein [Agrobacterium sp. S2]MBM7330692.1 hypothetical protein [Agrobacterium sp. S2]
ATPVAEPEAGGHEGKSAKGHGESKGGASGEHDAAPTEPGHGETAPEAHDETPSPEAHGETVTDELLTSTPEAEGSSIFSLSYLKSLIFGKGSTTAQAAEEKPMDGEAAVAEEAAGEKAKAGH